MNKDKLRALEAIERNKVLRKELAREQAVMKAHEKLLTRVCVKVDTLVKALEGTVFLLKILIKTQSQEYQQGDQVVSRKANDALEAARPTS